MNPIQRGSSGFNLGSFLILAALGTFIWKGSPLDSVRPSTDQGGWYEHQMAEPEQVPARLWQDPFKAVYAHQQKTDYSLSAPLIADESGSIPGITSELLNRDDEVDVNILLVLVSPGSAAVQEERRRRRRYAVSSGLGENYFAPQNPEMLNVFYQQNTSTKGDSYHAVPYEWYDYENPGSDEDGKKRALVLWLDESQFVETPLIGIKVLLEKLLPANDPKNSNIKATLLGPARSDTLRNLVNSSASKIEAETYKWLHCDSGLSEFNILSPSATVDDDNLVRHKKISNKEQQNSPLSDLQKRIYDIAPCSNKETSSTHMNFLRTIRSDSVLIKELAWELRENRLLLRDSDRDGKLDLNDRIVVISEWDTYFGRSLPRAFVKHFCNSEEANTKCGDNILKYHYQRGMDGRVAGKGSASSGQKNKSKPNGAGYSIDETSLRRPVGPGQFDYLRRLAADIKKKNEDWRIESGYGVRAVVLLGSDVYDKLLILRALRPELPGAIFATTDLDAQLLHPAEYNWTRNMIVASTFGLSLSSQIQMATMPFRDSYQTSIYLSTKLALNEDLLAEISADQEMMNKKIPPQLMEVGRQNLINLPGEIDKLQTWNRQTPQSFALQIAFGFFVITMLAIFAFHQLRPKAGRVVMVLGGLLILFLGLSALIWTKGSHGEPLSFFSGASIWPAEYIRLFGIVLALVYIWSVLHILHKNWKDLQDRYFIDGENYEENGVTVTELWKSFGRVLAHPIQIIKKIKPSHFFTILMIAVMILMMKSVLPIKLPLGEKIMFLVVVWGALVLSWWLLIYGHLNKNFKVLSVNKWDESFFVGDKDATKMWQRYGAYGAGDQRFMRTIAYILMYFTFASILFAILGPPASPCRGEFACNLDRMIMGFSVLSMLVLLFLVVDAARLCICWVSSMHKQDLDWSNTRKPEFIQRLRLPDSHAIAWMKVHLIGERTSDVTRLIYFPVTLILLLLLARSTYFDNWDFPQALAIVIGLNFIIALGSVVRLNFVAQSTRDDILRQLEDEQLAADRKEEVSYKPSNEERQALISQLQKLRIGAYLRVWDQPPVRGTLMLLGGVALTYVEYISALLY